MNSAIGKLNSRDFLKGFAVAVLMAVLTAFKTMLDNHGLDLTGTDFYDLGTVAVTAMVAYLLKNLASDENDKIGGIL